MDDDRKEGRKLAAQEFDAFGILNAAGDFWTHQTFWSVVDAREYIIRFWGDNKGMARSCLNTHRIVPVVATVVERRIQFQPTPSQEQSNVE